MDWATIIAGGTAIVGGVGAVGKTLIDVGATFKRVELTLEDHGKRLESIEKKMPNGEIEDTYKMVRELHDKVFGGQ